MDNPSIVEEVLRITWAARYPIIAAAILIGLPVYAQAKRREFLVAITSHEWPGHAATVAMAWINGAIVALTLGIILRLGAYRFEYACVIPDGAWHPLGLTIKRIDVVLPPLLALPTVLVLGKQARSWAIAIWGTLVGLAAGAAVSVLVLMFVANSGQGLVPWPGWFPDKAGYVALGAGGSGWPCVAPTPAMLGSQIAPRHLLAATMLFVLVAIYIFGYIWLHPSRKRKKTPPLVFYMWFLLAIAALLLPGMAFFFDFYRAPVVLILFAFAGITAGVLGRDHLFDVQRLNTPRVTVVDAIAARRAAQLGGKTPPAIFACASGGGIQAAAWTARVLTGLQAKLGERFPRSLSMISGVSGGSVGALCWAHGVDRGQGIPHPDDLEKIFHTATRPSLDEAAWGLAFADLVRGIAPPLASDVDRAWAVERAWYRHLCELAEGMSGRNAEKAPDAGHWRQETAEGTLPIIAFNTVTVEQGRHVVISTAGLFGEGDASNDFESLYDADLLPTPVTAARLSATFPFVTPVARARIPGEAELPTWHFADGGFFDNGGVYTAVRAASKWLAGDDTRRAVILEIEAFPPVHRSNPETSFGWMRNTFAPMQTLLSMRTSAQRERNRTEAEMLEDVHPQRVERIVLQPRGGRPPLSWHLDPDDIQAIEEAWADVAGSEPVRRLEALLREGEEEPG